MSANINNPNAVSFLSVADRKHVQGLISDTQQSKQQPKYSQDRIETASISSVSSTSALLKKSDKPKAKSTSENLNIEKLQAQGFMSQFRFTM